MDAEEPPGEHGFVLEPVVPTAAVSGEVVTATTRAEPKRYRTRPLVVGFYGLTMLVLVTLNFFVPRAMPGDPLTALSDRDAPSYVQSNEVRAKLERYYGLDRPLHEQYVSYVTDLARGDLSTSIRYNQPVADLIRERLPWTLLLVGTAMAVAAVVGLAAGVHSGWHRGRAIDRSLLTVFLGLRSFPVFFLGSLALFVFSVKLGWVPFSGAETSFSVVSPLERVVDIARHLVLPASVLAARFVADNYLYMRASMVGELGADYLLVGRAKGLRLRRLKYRYAARNALLPVVSLMAAQLAAAVGATIFVETVFAYPGLGRLLFESVSSRDYPMLQGCFLVLSVVVLTANLVVDLLYARLDPRITV